MKPFDLIITHYDKPALVLNENMLNKQKAWHNVPQIKKAHQLKLVILDMMMETNNKKALRSLAEDVTQIEFEFQRLWNFPQDARFHRPWYLPKCTCPNMDNDDNWGTGIVTINSDCLLHGS